MARPLSVHGCGRRLTRLNRLTFCKTLPDLMQGRAFEREAQFTEKIIRE
jgi:hypothetical protein